MATWHQMKAGLPHLYHATRWTVVDDPPHECLSLMRFATREEAEAYKVRRKEKGTGRHCYVLAPASEE